MRLLHTSDWHVGRTIRGHSRADEHRAVLAEIVAVAAREQVDLVLVAGDLFDLSAPTAESEQIVYRALLDLAETGAHVVLVSGNHDHPARLRAVAPLLALGRIHAGAYLAAPADGGVLELTTTSGARARVALLPFLSQRTIVRADDLMGKRAAQHVGDYAARCRQVVEMLTAGFTSDAVNIVLAHLTVVGGLHGGGERQAHTIFDYHVSPVIFPASAHYVALGHLHRPQRIAAPCPTWYSGSPLHLDFGEAAGDKVVLVVDAEPGVPVNVREVALTSGRRLRTVSGTLAQLEALGDLGDDFVRVIVDEPARAGLADEVRALIGNAVDVAVAASDGSAQHEEDLATLRHSPEELLIEYLTERGVDDTAVMILFRELLEGVDATDAA